MSKALFHCEIEYKYSPHLMQLYAGFFELKKLGIIDLKIKTTNSSIDKNPIINVIVNNKINVIYDTMDGLTWFPGTWDENIQYFKNNFKNINYYFKRSFHEQLLENNPGNCKVFPLGLNYNLQPKENLLFLTEGVNKKVKYLIKSNSLLKRVFKKQNFYAEDFEYYPIKRDIVKILFLTRLWDPNGTILDFNKEYRKKINEVRIECIKACKDKYGENFTGGVMIDSYSEKAYKEFTLSTNITSKGNFIDAVKDHSICIATAGLHYSTGWKFGEYVAASRAIVSEPLTYDLPGNFEVNKNYLQFETVEQLLDKIDMLLQKPDLIYQMMVNNFHYYNIYVKPEKLILNSLMTIANNE